MLTTDFFYYPKLIKLQTEQLYTIIVPSPLSKHIVMEYKMYKSF